MPARGGRHDADGAGRARAARRRDPGKRCVAGAYERAHRAGRAAPALLPRGGQRHHRAGDDPRPRVHRTKHLAAAAGGRGHRAVSAGCRGADLRRLALQPQAALPDRRSAADGGQQCARRALAGQAGGGKAAARPGKAERPARRARHAAARRDGLPAHQGQLPQRAGAGASAHAHRHLPGGRCLARRIHDAAPTGAVWRGEHGAAQLPLHDGDGHTLCVCPGAAIFDAQDEQRVHPALHAEGRQADGSAVDRGRGRAARSLRRRGGVLCGHRLREPQHAQPVLHLSARTHAGR